ncbi:orotate phosphoribosyltransferase [Lactobacillus delbrueckii]|uniref:Orotate phosphoribosyltransferase n=1 Tax=Lactobacillus delbrueckii TaxID=1584 RepID=A0ABD0AFR9_9LACO|nr:orotate phosphoribosyltransferase [Lactobacillus delbrueckii]EFK32618.1 orotate phosphoribosyltransferase [Lactobacillus delbrueckii subsp. bulgaricus PB2003/044-T3-4]MCD5536197.1 orotate phosphoribosyltransferase [Lactobacillus delbrueckii subsp. sunkii]GHN18520.1 orotate phosphoribosyltransferase [Lactobacillus delbrueckii]GHN33839.1 orotate phosphoribosyltransferase [Lactobacillus delbrueckii]GHN41547.1 orotate phosphoribosyltransferase [Lactobacillus delbrueckii]
MQNNEIIRQLIDKKIVTISTDKDFVYASGMHSPIYTDLRQTISFPKLRQAIAENLAALIKQEFPEVTVIGGVATAGIPHAAWVAQVMNLPMVYVRSKPKDHGQGRQIEGRLSMDDHIVLIDDLISTGGSVLSAVQAVKDTGAHVDGISSIFTYLLPDANENFKKADAKFVPLLNYRELIEQEIAETVSEEQYKELLAWHQDPWNWKR